MNHGVEWDDGNWPKCGKHGVSKENIEFVLRDALVAPDLRHSHVEDRFIAVGADPDGRPVFVGFTFRSIGAEIVIRPLTARYMHKKEAQRYVSQSSPHDDRQGT
ncbi:MAG: BrnT family toxin [Mesorhizobium sp.]|nr:BrnT family toxin [Mesorhizobium sp.]